MGKDSVQWVEGAISLLSPTYLNLLGLRHVTGFTDKARPELRSGFPAVVPSGTSLPNVPNAIIESACLRPS